MTLLFNEYTFVNINNNHITKELKVNGVLVIIDMQWEFLKSLDDHNKMHKLIHNICQKIEQFKKQNLPIVIVEYVFDNKSCVERCVKNLYTVRKIVNQVKSYKHLYYATKNEDSGANEIIRSLQGYQYLHTYDETFQNTLYVRPEPFHLTKKTVFCLTGVNTTACVLDTAIGLYHRGYQSTISMFCSLDTFTNEWAYETTILFEEDIQQMVQLTI